MTAVISYLTDLEGQWDKLATFADDNPHVALDGDRLVLAEHVTFVFGGDAVDRGPHARRIVRTLLAARRTYGPRVVLLAGNRDLNKLRLVRELASPPKNVPVFATRGELLRWILTHTMGAPAAFDHRATELGTSDSEAVVQSMLDDLGPGGDMRAYLTETRLAHRIGSTLFVHGAVTAENLFVTPHAPRATGVDAWLAALATFHGEQMARFTAGDEPTALIKYQGPRAGQASVIYARPTDELGNPHLPPPDVIAALRAGGIERIVVGHTPSGDCPALVRDGDFELVLADNSYGRVERGSQLVLTDRTTTVRGTTQLDDGRLVDIGFSSPRDDGSPLGHLDRNGRLIKAQLVDGSYLRFRGPARHQVEQVDDE